MCSQGSKHWLQDRAFCPGSQRHTSLPGVLLYEPHASHYVSRLCVRTGSPGEVANPSTFLVTDGQPCHGATRVATVVTLSLRCPLGLSFLTGSVRPMTDLPQRCVMTAAGQESGKGRGDCFATKNTSPGIPKVALICPQVTLSCVTRVSGREAPSPCCAGAGLPRSSPAGPGCAFAHSPGILGSGRPRCFPRTLGRQRQG